VGEISPEEVVTPGVYVDYLVEAEECVEWLGSSASSAASIAEDDARMTIARRARAELSRGDVVNLGVGIPTLIADLIAPSDGIALHTENGLLGVGPAPSVGSALDYPTNAAKQPVTAVDGAAYFSSDESFAMIRGGHIDIAVMGALQVDAGGALANWAVPNRPLLGVGGAMDLASGAKTLVITMTHTTRDGDPKIVPSVTLPMTAPACVDAIVTELAVFRFERGALVLTELLPGASLEQVRASTAAAFEERLP
jgi:3-oxoacid CoA-transferase